jgi:putative transposase
MVDYLAVDGIEVGRDRVRHLMRGMGLRALNPKPRTTVPGDPSERFACLFDLEIIKAPDEVWATDITYIPLQKDFLYLVAIDDLYSRHILSWKLSNSLETEFFLEALEMALGNGRFPRIFHSDQGCQFTSPDFVERLEKAMIRLSWSGRKRCYCFAEACGNDNILVERLWRTVKYVAVGFSPKASIGVLACLQQWLGCGNRPGPLPLQVLPYKTSSLTGRKNRLCGLY